jgi:hypothetical protein
MKPRVRTRSLAGDAASGLRRRRRCPSFSAPGGIALINNKGDVGKTLKQLGSSQTAKATIAAALTAGVLDKLQATSTMKDLSAKTGFSEKLTYNLINASGRALTNTAINGGNLEDALKQALIGGLVDTAHGQAASHIKGIESQYLAHKLAHALAGCVAGTAAQGTCRDGAIGGAVGEIVAEMFKGQRPGPGASAAAVAAYNDKVLAYSKLVAGAVSAYAGGNAQTAITTAETAVRNNFLDHRRPQMLELSEKEQYDRATSECGPSNPLSCQLASALRDLSHARDQQLQQACAAGPTPQCNTLTNQAMNMGNNVRREGNFVWANSRDANFALNISTLTNSPAAQQTSANPALTNNWHHNQARSLSQGILLSTLAATPGAAQGGAAKLAAGAQSGMQATINALRAEAQLLQFGYYRYAVPAGVSGAIWVSNPANVQNTVDLVQGLFPGSPPTTRAGVVGGVVGTFVLPADWYK